MHKQHAIPMFRPWPQTGAFGLHLCEVVAKLKQAMQIPTGYQDETGFHFGAESAEKEIQWPPV
jgi:hypothetical protein